MRARPPRALALATLGLLWICVTGEAVEARAVAMMVEPPPPPFDPRVHEPVVSRDQGPPAISGGTLATVGDGQRIVVADPDTDRVLVVSSVDARVTLELSQPRGAEPGRIVEDAHGRVHVVLRGRGEVLSFDPSASEARAAHASARPVCQSPRGIAYDRGSDQLIVACRGGELVWLPAAGGPPSRTVALDPDLRDVVLTDDRLVVTRFRAAEALVVDRTDGRVLARRNAPAQTDGATVLSSAVAWRAIALPGGEIAMLHQRESDGEVVPAPGGYGGFGGCDGIVRSAITLFGADAPVVGATLAAAALPVDIAARIDANGALVSVAVVAAGNQNGQRSVFLVAPQELRAAGCGGGGWVGSTHPLANAVAVSYLPDGQLAVQTRAPSRVVIVGADARTSREVLLGGEDTFDTGHAIFHTNAGANVACASCHPEGHEDGHVWRFSGLGPRRTPALHDVAGTAPFHWEGDLPTIHALFNEVFVGRMNGQPLPETHSAALEGWLGHVHRPAPHRGDAASITRGRAVFEGAGGCVACHSGARLSDGESHDVGTGRSFQTPTLLGVSARLPVMHDGCASTLRARFEPACGGDRHGGAVEGAALDDLLAYLASL